MRNPSNRGMHAAAKNQAAGDAPVVSHLQYASKDYTKVLHEHGIRSSMSRKGSPWDNAVIALFLPIAERVEVCYGL